MNMLRREIIFSSLLGQCSIRLAHAAGGNQIAPGDRYEIVGPLFAYGVRDDLGKKAISTVNLHTLNFTGPEIVWRRAVPEGTTMTIVASAPSPIPWLSFLFHDRYFVSLEKFALDVDVPIIVEVYGAVADGNAGLNPKFFRRL